MEKWRWKGSRSSHGGEEGSTVSSPAICTTRQDKRKKRGLMPHPSRILTKNPGDNHLKHYDLETRTLTMTKKLEEDWLRKKKKREKKDDTYIFIPF